MTRLLTIGGAAVIVVFLLLALRNGDRTAVVGWLWAVAACVPVCRMPWAERYAYLPAVGLALVAAAALNRLRDRRKTAVRMVVVAVLSVFAAGSLLSAFEWTRRVGRFSPQVQNRSSAAAQWKPAPKAVR